MKNLGNERLIPKGALGINLPFSIPKFGWGSRFRFRFPPPFCEVKAVNDSDFEFQFPNM